MVSPSKPENVADKNAQLDMELLDIATRADVSSDSMDLLNSSDTALDDTDELPQSSIGIARSDHHISLVDEQTYCIGNSNRMLASTLFDSDAEDDDFFEPRDRSSDFKTVNDEDENESRWTFAACSRLENIACALQKHFGNSYEHKMLGLIDSESEVTLLENLSALCFNNRRDMSNEVSECEVVYRPNISSLRSSAIASQGQVPTDAHNERNEHTPGNLDQTMTSSNVIPQTEIRLRYSFPLSPRSACLLRCYGPLPLVDRNNGEKPIFSRRSAFLIVQPTIHSVLVNLGFFATQRYVMKGCGYRWANDRIRCVVFKTYLVKVKEGEPPQISNEPMSAVSLVEISSLALSDQIGTIKEMQTIASMMQPVRWLVTLPSKETDPLYQTKPII